MHTRANIYNIYLINIVTYVHFLFVLSCAKYGFNVLDKVSLS
jgi:hypothetical protein